MSNLSKEKLRSLIMQELLSMGEEKLISPMDQSKELGIDTVYNLPDEYDDYDEEQDDFDQLVFEGSCGCDDKGDYSLGTMGDLGMVMDIMSPGEAFGTGAAVGHHDHGGAYMSKSQLYKIAKYAEKLYSMIPKGYDLEDWMRSKLSSIADDISEVYHALDHDKFEGDL
jgi:hypothetical protein